MCVLRGGQGEMGRTLVALWSLVRRVGLGLGRCHSWHVWNFTNKFLFIGGIQTWSLSSAAIQ